MVEFVQKWWNVLDEVEVDFLSNEPVSRSEFSDISHMGSGRYLSSYHAPPTKNSVSVTV
jgi:hypothetical protein